jgi:L-fuconolactonase
MSERIDAHHHLWRYSKAEYPWINDTMKLIACDFLAADLEKEAADTGIQGTVAVQARQSLEETRALLESADASTLIRGVVGWAPIASPDLTGILDEWQSHKKLVGLRHVVQDEPDEQFLLRREFNAGICELRKHSLVYDLLIYERHLPVAMAFVDRHPKQIFVLDHVAKPLIRERQLEPWSRNIRELARRSHVFCKLSGMVTEADWSRWQPADLQPFFDVVLEAFGPERLMAGSDWPVCLLASAYSRWWDTLDEFLQPLSSAEQNLIFGKVASEVYALPGKPSSPGAAA